MTDNTVGFPSDAAIPLKNDVMSSGDGGGIVFEFFGVCLEWSGGSHRLEYLFLAEEKSTWYIGR